MEASAVFTWIFFIVCVIMAVLYCFSGYRHFRGLISVYIFLSVFPGILSFMYANTGMSDSVALLVSLGIAALLAVITWAIYKVAIFMCGGLLGFWIASSVFQAGGDPAARIVLTIILIIVFGIIAIKFRKILIIISSSIIGAFSLFVYGYYIVFEFANISSIPVTEAAQLPSRFVSVVGDNYFLYIIPIVLAIIGMAVQARNSSKRRRKKQQEPY